MPPIPTDAERPRPASGTRSYRVKAVWPTLQGEGAWAGRAAVFVRFVGCNLWSGHAADRARDAERTGADCPRWCDTDFTRAGSDTFTAEALAAHVAASGQVPEEGSGAASGTPIRFCVLTGGEPLLQADAALIRALHAEGIEVAVETNGTVALKSAFGADPAAWPDWVVCSPKLPVEALALEACDELKLVVPDYTPATHGALAERVRPHAVAGRDRRWLWLQPEDGPRWAAARDLAVAWALKDPRWRVSVQTHKVLDVP